MSNCNTPSTLSLLRPANNFAFEETTLSRRLPRPSARAMSRERDAFTCRASPSASPGAACEAGSDVVQLNVGGVHFTTTKSTLSAEPRSMLAAMCAPGRAFGTPLSNKSTPGVAVGSPHATGPVPVHFLDRCGERFKHVLKCVRPAGAAPSRLLQRPQCAAHRLAL